MRPLIGITCGRFFDDPNRARCGQNMSYINAVALAGGAPLLIPLVAEEISLRAIFDTLDGLLLTGGVDIAPARYGESPHPNLGAVDKLRDEVEIILARWAVESDLPTFGICRGIQTLNVALGGTLYQDIPAQIQGALTHPYQSGNPRDHIAHTIEIALHSQLGSLLPADMPVEVNSMHHQAVRDLAPGFVITSRAPDGVIEAIEAPNKRFALAVQWHPEEMVERHPQMRALFSALVAAARK
jgi:putative glutamine amidotransferase